MSISGENNLLFFDFFIVLSKFLSAYFAKKEAKDMYALSDLKNKEAIDISCGRYLGRMLLLIYKQVISSASSCPAAYSGSRSSPTKLSN